MNIVLFVCSDSEFEARIQRHQPLMRKLYRLKRKYDKFWRDKKDIFVCAVIVSLFIVHPSIMAKTVQMWNCHSVDGQPYLLSDMSEK